MKTLWNKLKEFWDLIDDFIFPVVLIILAIIGYKKVNRKSIEKEHYEKKAEALQQKVDKIKEHVHKVDEEVKTIEKTQKEIEDEEDTFFPNLND